MNLLARIVGKWAAKRGKRELTDFVMRLRVGDSSEIAFVLAGATDIRHQMFELKGWRFLEPALEVSRDPMIITQVGDLVRASQRQKLPQAGFLMVWAHSLRAVSSVGQYAELRTLGRDMWRELSRGFDKVEEAAVNARAALGINLNIEGYDQIPARLTPEPL